MNAVFAQNTFLTCCSAPPPGYTSPYQNQHSTFANQNRMGEQYYGYAHHQQYDPQELPVGPEPAAPAGKQTYGHSRGFSELSGDTALAVEMGTPTSPAQNKHMSYTPGQDDIAITSHKQQPSPMIPQAVFTHRNSPVSPPEPRFSAQSGQRRQERWSAPRNWESEDTTQNPTGLGVQGLDHGDKIDVVEQGRTDRMF